MSDLPSWARPGVKVVCIKREPWTLLYGVDHGPDPAFGDVVVIDGVSTFGTHVMLSLVGFQDCYGAVNFRPLISQQDDLEAHFVKLLDVPANHERETV